MDVRFHQLESLGWLWAVLMLLLVMLAGIRLRNRDMRRFAGSALRSRLTQAVAPGRPWLRRAVLLAALVFLVGAMIDPRWGITYRTVQQRGNDIVIVLDISRSMLAEDARPNRLERAKQFIRDLLDELGGDRVALVTFAGVATVRCPLTVDYGALWLALEEVSPQGAPRGGSSLGEAVRAAAEAFTDEVPNHKVILVLSDGEDHGGVAIEAARQVHEARGIPIFTVGIGDAGDGARIPIIESGRRTFLMHDGQQVWSKMNHALLREVALAAGGAYVPVGTGTVDLGRVYRERIEPAGTRRFDETEVRRRRPRYQWFAGLALSLLLFDSFLGDQRRLSRFRPGGEARS